MKNTEMNTLCIDVEWVGGWGQPVSHPFLPISCLSITAIAVKRNVRARRLGWMSRKDALTFNFKSMTDHYPLTPKKKKPSPPPPHSESHTNGACWHSRMPIITSRAHQSQVLFRCMPFDHHRCLHCAHTFSHFTICIYNL